MTITVNEMSGGNTAPVAADNYSYSVDAETTLAISAAGVLANDTDADGDPLTAVLDSSTSYGTVSLNADGSFTYSPSTGFTGSDSFTYHATDGTDSSNTATVTITVNQPTSNNTAPVAADDYSYSVDAETTLTVPASGVLANDTDADGNPLTAVLDSSTCAGRNSGRMGDLIRLQSATRAFPS